MKADLTDPGAGTLPAGTPSRLGRYEIIERIGRGASGSVYRAEDRVIQRTVALKTVPKPDATSTLAEHEGYARFVREAWAAGRLAHPNVVTVFDVGEADGLSYIAMELVEGESLLAVLMRRERLSWDRIRDIGADVASALAAAHAAGIVHRDIKPANLILTVSGQVKVADFGIAKIASASMTQDGTLLGSPGYMSPEQVKATEVDHRSDLFSLGTVLYELAALTPAFKGKTIFEVIQQVAAAEVRPLRELRPDLPADLEAVIARAMARAPEQRFNSAREMEFALRADAAPDIPRGSLLVDVLAEDVRSSSPVETAAEPVATGTPAAGGAAPAATDAAVVADPGTVRIAPSPRRPPATARTRLARSAAVLAAILAAAVVRSLLPASLPAVEAPPLVALDGPTRDFAVARALSEDFELPPAAEPVPQSPAAVTPRPSARTGSEAAARGSAPASPAPSQSTVPAVEHPFPFVLRVVHDHRFGSCEGTLSIGDDTVRYDADTRAEDSRTLRYDELREVEFGAGELLFVEGVRDARSLGLRSKRYRFRFADAALPAAAARHLTLRVGR